MKTYFQISLKVFTILLTVMLVCISCGKNNNAGVLGGKTQEDMYNPAKTFTAYKPIYNVEKVDDETHYYFKNIHIWDANGEVRYSDEDAEENYAHYTVHFFYAYKIASIINSYYSNKQIGLESKSYVDENLFNIVCSLPLDESYPNDLREMINKIYYDYKDRALDMNIYERGYGYIEYAYEITNRGTIYCLKMYRDTDSGALTVATSVH